jgi:hypothetical protein
MTRATTRHLVGALGAALVFSSGCQPQVPTRVAKLPARVARFVTAPDTSETIHYCAGTVTYKDTVRCVVDLTAEEHERRSDSRRLVYRGGRLVNDGAVLSSGWLVPDERRAEADMKTVGSKAFAIATKLGSSNSWLHFRKTSPR